MSLPGNKNEILWINTLKGICILLVVLHHSIITTLAPSLEYLTAGYLPAKIWVKFNLLISPLRMPAFFFVSGFLASKAMGKRWPDIFTKKVGNLLYLYLLWGIIQWFFIKEVISPIAELQLSDAENSAYAETPVKFLTLLTMAKTSLWYLYALAGYFVISKLFINFKYILIALAILLNYSAAFNLLPGWGLNSLAQNMIFFLLGVFLSDELIKSSEVNKKNIALWITLFIIGVLNVKLGIIKNLFICIASIIALIFFCRKLNHHFNMSWLNWIGRNTLQIYVIHRIFIELIGVIALGFGVEHGIFDNKNFSTLWGLLFPVFAVISCTLASIIIWSILNKGIGKMLFSHPTLVKLSPKVKAS